MPGPEVARQRLGGAADPTEVECFGGPLGLCFQGGEVVVVGVEEVPYLVVGFGGQQAGGVLGGGQGDDPLRDVPVALMEGDESPGHLRVVAGHVGELLLRDRARDRARLVQERRPQIGGQTFLAGLGEELRIDAEDLGDPQQHRSGQRPPTVFDLVEVAGGQAQGAGQFDLVHAPLTAQPA